jgi:lipopolysaccharide export LptBFGC system permease protein LptF
MGLDTRTLEVSYHLKAAVPVACVVLALCAPVLSFLLARAGGFVGVLLAIVLVFVFWNTLLLFQILGNHGVLPPTVGGVVAEFAFWRRRAGDSQAAGMRGTARSVCTGGSWV